MHDPMCFLSREAGRSLQFQSDLLGKSLNTSKLDLSPVLVETANLQFEKLKVIISRKRDP